jgi:hypothetical protein
VPEGLTNVWVSGCRPGFVVVVVDAVRTVGGLEDRAVDVLGVVDARATLGRVPEWPRELLAEFLPDEFFFEVDVFCCFFPLMLDACVSCEFLDTDT